MVFRKWVLFFLLPFLVFAQGYITFIGSLTSQKLPSGSVLKFENISINLPVLLGGLISAEVLPPSVCEILKKFKVQTMQPLTIKEIKVAFTNQTRTIEISKAQNNFIAWEKITFITSPQGERIEIKNLTLNSPILNTLNLKPIHIESLVFETSKKGKYLKIKQIRIFNGEINSILVDLTSKPVVEIKNISNLSLEEAIKLAKFFSPSLALQIEGNLSLKSLKIKTSPTLVAEAKNLAIEQDEGGLELSKVVYTEGSGIFLEGEIDNFLITNGGKDIYISGNFERSKQILTNKFELSVELPQLVADINGYFSVKRKYTELLLKEVRLSLLGPQAREKKEVEQTKEQKGLNLSQIIIKLPSLPFNVKVHIEKFVLEPVSIKIPKVKLRDHITANNIYFEYIDGVYSAHVAICFNDVYLNADTNGNLSFLTFTINNPLSAILGCFIKDIDLPKLKDVFFNGYISLYLLGSINDGKLSTLKGLYEFSLLKGFFFLSDKFTLEGFLGKVYNAMGSLLRFLGINYQEVNYDLYSAGRYALNEHNTFTFSSKTYLITEHPIKAAFGGFAGGVYNLRNGRGFLTLKGYTKLPFKLVEIVKRIPIGGKRK